ncbi:two-component system sensor histidine kinase NtrB [Desulfovulcanus sp.]
MPLKIPNYKTNGPWMKSKSFILIFASFFFGLAGFLLISLYFNYQLEALLKIQTSAQELVVSWNRVQSLNKEVIITYELEKKAREWLAATKQFGNDFKEFIETISRHRSMINDLNFRIKVTKTDMHWSVVEKRVKETEKRLKEYLSNPAVQNGSGNLLVDFGVSLNKGEYDHLLTDLLEKLRWTTFMHRYTFNKSLTDVTQHATKKIQEQIYRLKIIFLCLSAFILTATGIFVILHIAELSRSKKKIDRYAADLSVKVNELDNAERQLRSEKDKLQAVINALGEGTYVVNNNFFIEFQSLFLEDKFPQAVGKKCYQAYINRDKPCDFCLSIKTIKMKILNQVETVRNNGRHHELTFSPFIDVDRQVKNIVLIRDITARKLAEAEATRAGYLASIGELAAGVAHEINNPIHGIISLAEMVQDNAADESRICSVVERIIKEGERIAGIVSNLLSFARERDKEIEIADISDILKNSLELIEKQIEKDGINLVIDFSPDLSKIRVVSQEIQQVFLNLLSNARYALNQKYAGADINKILKITGYCVNIDENHFVRMVFHDSGIGIPDEDLGKVRQPFYSTKPSREGTGLGLSISQEIVTSYEGKISIESKYGVFTTVIVDLPVFSD